jgi:hypothetical protein
MRENVGLPRARKKDLVIRELDDETLVYDTERDEAHCLNQTAALVWKHCDGKTTVSQAAQSLQRKLEVPVGADIIWLAVKQLQRFHLVEGSQKSPSVSRRALVLKYAPAALALPVIMSITAPAAFGAASCALTNTSCATLPCCLSTDFCSGSFVCLPG